jgi:hypothetical protein
VYSEHSEKETEEKCHPFVFHKITPLLSCNYSLCICRYRRDLQSRKIHSIR